MKKFLLGMVAMIAIFSFSASAQSVSADFTSLDKLVEKLTKACAKAPKPSGVAEVDAFLDGNVKAALGAVATAEQLHNLYSRQIGETKDGVQDVTVTNRLWRTGQILRYCGHTDSWFGRTRNCWQKCS